MKTCTRCKTEKPLTDFHKSKRRKDGRHPQCKECLSEYTRQVRARAPERYKKYGHVRYANNKEAMLKSRHEWAVRNPEKIKERGKRDIEKASDWYLRSNIASLKQADKETLAAYRETLLARREAKEIQKLINSIEKEIENVTEAN